MRSVSDAVRTLLTVSNTFIMKKIVGLFYKMRLKRLYALLTRDIVDTILSSDDYDQARQSFEIADRLIEKGDMMMACFIGLAYLDENKSWHNPVKAKRYMEISANGGFPEAQWYMGMIYYLDLSGDGQDPVYGGYWVREAAANGSKYAKQFLKMQEEGFNAI